MPRYSRLIFVFLLNFISSLYSLEHVKADRLILITIDGIRREEVFSGLQQDCLDIDHISLDKRNKVLKRYWDNDPVNRRKKLMPFFWNTMVNNGQLFGCPDSLCEVIVNNPFYTSYPGYNEMLTGEVDPNIFSNDPGINPNQTIFEWLNKDPQMKEKIAIFTSWDYFHTILNTERSEIFVNSGWQKLSNKQNKLSVRQKLINDITADLSLHFWEDSRFDKFTFYQALDYLKEHKPKILFISFNDSDCWGHKKSYNNYLQSLNAIDKYLEILWKAINKIPEYRNRTSIVITTDHGRGGSAKDWTEHKCTVPNSRYGWIYVYSPNIEKLGIRKNANENIYLNQIAPTIAYLLGKKFSYTPPLNFEEGN